MGHAALSASVHLPVSGSFFPSPADDLSLLAPDTGSDLGVSWCGWCPDGLSEPVIDRLYSDLIDHAVPVAERSGPGDEPVSAPVFAFPDRPVSAGQQRVSGGEAA